VSEIESLIFLLATAALLAQFARLLKVPYPILLVVGGLVMGFVPGLPDIEIPPEVIFVVFLPPRLMGSRSSKNVVLKWCLAFYKTVSRNCLMIRNSS
jgi:NhaP-type Na+/H+ or K+/H+ antiporter